MTDRLRPSWEQLCRRKNRAGRPYGAGGLEDHLLVMLILYRCHITQDFLGLLYGVDKATICRSLRRIEPLARRVLGVKRAIRVWGEEAQALLIDATEQPVQRPQRKQKCWYSGKKKRHSIKNEIITTEKGQIVSVSKSAPGTVHDIMIRRRGPPLPENTRVYVDSGYQGYQDDHPAIDIPYKKPRKGKLSIEEKEYNHALSRFRVRVEHAIGRMKRFRILADRYRYPRNRHSVKFAIIAGITNLMAGF
ncbi:transposase family protein [Sneathiella sp.]|uniref:HARBI1 family protein n=1 Tax=Sneathiella sp. TaxID=1964365 RepID=UPI0035659B4F